MDIQRGMSCLEWMRINENALTLKWLKVYGWSLQRKDDCTQNKVIFGQC